MLQTKYERQTGCQAVCLVVARDYPVPGRVRCKSIYEACYQSVAGWLEPRLILFPSVGLVHGGLAHGEKGVRLYCQFSPRLGKRAQGTQECHTLAVKDGTFLNEPLPLNASVFMRIALEYCPGSIPDLTVAIARGHKIAAAPKGQCPESTQHALTTF